MAGRRMTASEVVDMMATGIAAKQAKIKAGLDAPKRGPRTGAKAEEEKYYAELGKVVANRTWNPDNWTVSDSEILAAAKKAVPTIAAQVRLKKDKIVKKMQPALDDTYSAADEVAADDTSTREARIAKSQHYLTLRGEKADTRKGIGVGGA